MTLVVDGRPPSRLSTVPYFWSDWYGKRIQFVGTAATDDVELLSGGPDSDRFVAAIWHGERLMGAGALA